MMVFFLAGFTQRNILEIGLGGAEKTISICVIRLAKVASD